MEDKPKNDNFANLKKAGVRALGGGTAGAMAMGINVLTLMWLRTTINYQYRYGKTTKEALKALYNDGGIVRFYRGLLPALAQGPLSRFGDTAANAGTLALLDSYDSTRDLGAWIKTGAASVTAGAWRMFLMPIDTCKTAMQVEGSFSFVVAKVRTHGFGVLYHGAVASAVATMVGHYPWFATYNVLNGYLPKQTETLKKLSRSAFIGFCASIVSDTCSNSIRVVKVYKQSSKEAITYPVALRRVIQEDGMIGLFGRGLKTKFLANGLQGLMFSVLWKAIEDQFFKH